VFAVKCSVSRLTYDTPMTRHHETAPSQQCCGHWRPPPPRAAHIPPPVPLSSSHSPFPFLSLCSLGRSSARVAPPSACDGVLQCVEVCCSVLQCVAVCCSVLQCVAVCCSVLQCVVCAVDALPK